MSAIDELVSAYHDAIGLSECEITDSANLKLAALRAAAAERDELREALHGAESSADDMRFERDELKRTVAAQAEQLKAARDLLTDLDWNDWSDKADAWLAAYEAQHAE